MRRLAIALVMTPLAGLAGLSLLGTPAQAAEVRTVPPTEPVVTVDASAAVAEGLAPVDVLEVSGLFDEVTVQSIIDTIERVEASDSQALVLQMSSGGAVVSNERMVELIHAVRDAEIGIGIWVGPSRDALVYGTPAQLFGVADVTAMVAGAKVGFTGELLDPSVDLGSGAALVRGAALQFSEARAAGILRYEGAADLDVPTMRNMIDAMDGVALEDGSLLDTISEELDDQGNTQAVSTLVRFNSLGLLEQLFHTVASPPIAYLFFIIGACLLIFEFFTAGVGVAGFVGAALILLGSYGLSALPTRTGAMVLLVLAMLAFAVDVQVGIPRFWTGVGVVMFVLGSWFLYDDLPGTSLRLGWITLVVGVAGVLLTFIVGMPSMVRTRFATPTIGREWMIGTDGVAVGAIDPEGVAQVGQAKWRARTNRATPLAAGDALKVVAIDGVTLEVEPVEGAARDYRERRPKGDGAAAESPSPSASDADEDGAESASDAAVDNA